MQILDAVVRRDAVLLMSGGARGARWRPATDGSEGSGGVLGSAERHLRGAAAAERANAPEQLAARSAVAAQPALPARPFGAWGLGVVEDRRLRHDGWPFSALASAPLHGVHGVVGGDRGADQGVASDTNKKGQRTGSPGGRWWTAPMGGVGVGRCAPAGGLADAWVDSLGPRRCRRLCGRSPQRLRCWPHR